MPTKFAKQLFLYGPTIVRKEERRSIFGEETAKSYNKLIHYSDLIWQKDENFEFEENLPERFLITLLNDVISLYIINKPKEYEYVLYILFKFTRNREKIYYTRFCFGFGYTYYEDDVDEFIKIYNSGAKNDTCYDMFYE